MEQMRYINKSVFIEALEFNGKNLDDVLEFIEFSNCHDANIINNVLQLYVKTPDHMSPSWNRVMPGEFLVKDATGWIEIYPAENINNYWIPFNY